MHTYRHFDHPQQYKTMILSVKNSQLILTCVLTVLDFLSALDIPWQVYQHFDWLWPVQSQKAFMGTSAVHYNYLRHDFTSLYSTGDVGKTAATSFRLTALLPFKRKKSETASTFVVFIPMWKLQERIWHVNRYAFQDISNMKLGF